MGPVVKREDLQGVLNQVNGRFDWFTRRCNELENRIKVLEKVANVVAPKEEKAKESK